MISVTKWLVRELVGLARDLYLLATDRSGYEQESDRETENGSMPVEKEWPVAVVDTECDPPWVVTRCKNVREAEKFIKYLHTFGGKATARKVERGDYSIDAPEEK